MITRTVKVQVTAFILLGLLGMSFVAVRYVGVGDRLLGRWYEVYADFAEAGGLFANAPVTYRGFGIGRVDEVTLHDGGARARLRLSTGTRVPADLRAIVAQRSAVGEQYLDLRPDSDTGPYLRDGSVIPRDRTGVPLAPETLLANLDALVRSVNPHDLAVVIDELGTAFEGSETALQRILDAGSALLAEATAHLPQTVDLLRDGRTVLITQEESASAIRQWAAGLAQVAASLRAADADLRAVIANGPPAARELVVLLDGLEPSIGTLLGNLVTVNGITARRVAGVEQILVVYPLAVAGGFTVAPGDGTAHLGLVVNVNDPPACVYGQSPTCSTADRASGSGVRSASNAPRPGGGAGPGAGPGPGPAPPPSTTDPTNDPGGAVASPPVPGVAGYDPTTGLVLAPGGTPMRFGGTGGQYQLAGDESWKQLLLAGLAP